jgi:wyosine [tRNA(Phe)-imidazoG37] synthetase (radical SAM superfamily)
MTKTAPSLATTASCGQFVRPRLCPRTRGVCLEVDLNPDCRCQFDCIYCSVDRRAREPFRKVDVHRLIEELTEQLSAAGTDPVTGRGIIQHVVVSGGGEPTVSPQFAEAMEGILHLRALRQHPFFKIVLMTNAVALHEPVVARTLKLLCRDDEIWVKLDAGSPAWMEVVNRPESPAFERVLTNLRHLGRQRPIVVQSLFPQVSGKTVSPLEIENYARLLKQLADDGVQIAQVQIYSASQPTNEPSCGHLPLRTLSDIVRQVRQHTGLKVEVF